MGLALFFALLLAGALLAASAFWLAMMWLLEDPARDPEAVAAPLTLSDRFAREFEARALWRSLSAWMSAKPLRIEQRKADRHAG